MNLHHRTFDTGDINLTAACLSIGIPLNDHQPCSLILRDNGGNYARFHLMTVSLEGGVTTDDISNWWARPSACNNAHFSQIMDFISTGKRAGCKGSHDWLDHAICYLADMGVTHHPKSMKDIPDYINNDPNSMQSHILAFCYNREHAYQTLKTARRRIMMSKGPYNHVCIDSHLEQWKKNELLARLEG